MSEMKKFGFYFIYTVIGNVNGLPFAEGIYSLILVPCVGRQLKKKLLSSKIYLPKL